MIKKHPLFFVLLAFVLGAVLGGLGMAKYYGAHEETFMRTTCTAEAGLDISCLKHLRVGDTNYVGELLEANLDGSLVGFWALQSDVPAAQRDPVCLKMLQRAWDYRAEFPRKSGNLAVDESVAEAFTLLKGQGTP